MERPWIYEVTDDIFDGYKVLPNSEIITKLLKFDALFKLVVLKEFQCYRCRKLFIGPRQGGDTVW